MTPFAIFKYVPLPVLRVLARFVAWIMRLLPNLTVKRIIDTNLRLVYPNLTNRQRQRMLAEVITHQNLTSVESVKAWAMPPKWSLEQIHSVHNQAVLEAALAHPNGMLAIVPHLGTWEVMNAWLNQFGSPTIMYKPVKNKWADDFVLAGRERLNAQLVPTDATGVKAIFKTLKQGGFSIILPDHVPKRSGGVNVPFFGINTLTSTLAPKLASKTECALVGLTCIRREDGQGFDIYCYALDDPALYDKNIKVASGALNSAIQTMINKFPTHYTWGYKRFKNIPKYGNVYKLSEQKLQYFITELHNK